MGLSVIAKSLLQHVTPRPAARAANQVAEEASRDAGKVFGQDTFKLFGSKIVDAASFDKFFTNTVSTVPAGNHLTLQIATLDKKIKDWSYPVLLGKEEVLNSQMFLGKDKGIYLQQWAPGQSQYFRIGSFQSGSEQAKVGEALKVTFDSGIKFQPKERGMNPMDHDEIRVILADLPSPTTPELLSAL